MDAARTIHTIQLDPADQTLVQSFARHGGFGVSAHGSLTEFLAAIRSGEASIAVLNVGPAGQQALAALDDFNIRGVRIPVVLLVDAPSTELTVAAMQKGAASVLCRPLDPGRMERELAIAAGKEQQERTVRTRRETIASRLASLNEGEREVLARLLAGMANKNIAAELQIGLRTVELRRAKILQKLRAKSLPEMVRMVLLAQPERLYGE